VNFDLEQTSSYFPRKGIFVGFQVGSFFEEFVAFRVGLQAYKVHRSWVTRIGKHIVIDDRIYYAPELVEPQSHENSIALMDRVDTFMTNGRFAEVDHFIAWVLANRPKRLLDLGPSLAMITLPAMSRLRNRRWLLQDLHKLLVEANEDPSDLLGGLGDY
jgi:hypothetical protein